MAGGLEWDKSWMCLPTQAIPWSCDSGTAQLMHVFINSWERCEELFVPSQRKQWTAMTADKEGVFCEIHSSVFHEILLCDTRLSAPILLVKESHGCLILWLLCCLLAHLTAEKGVIFQSKSAAFWFSECFHSSTGFIFWGVVENRDAATVALSSI